MLSDNNYDEASAEKVRSYFEGKAFDKLLGRWVKNSATGEVLLIRCVNLEFDPFSEPEFKLSLIPPSTVESLIARKEDFFASPGHYYNFSDVVEGKVNASDKSGNFSLNFCEPPEHLAHVRLSEDMRAFLETGILGTMRTHEMGLGGSWGRPFTGSYRNNLAPIKGLWLSEFDGERFSIQIITGIASSKSPAVYRMAATDGYLKTDPVLPTRGLGRDMPTRYPSQDS